MNHLDKLIDRANKALEVAEVEKAEALMVASKELEVAEYAAQAAEQEKKAIISLAEGKEKAIELSGAITETVRVLAQINAEKEVQISANLKDIQSPGMIFQSGNGEGSGGMQMPLINIAIMKAAGILPADFSITNPITTPVN